MPSLSRDNRKLLENTVVAARSIAEKGAEKSLISLGVAQREASDSLTQQERNLRNQLRAHGWQLGDSRSPGGVQEQRHLTQAVAYEHWHRMLFARFLAENDLLMHPDYGIAMSMDEVREAAREQGADWLSLAVHCAQHMLIEVFKADDPVLRVVLPPETRLELEQKLEQLPVEVFTAADSLGWVYQFWQSDEKERVNKSEVKIGPDEMAPVTQLFTEDYMVLFLLHNTLGAWWTAKRRAEGKSNELQGYGWRYLRLNDDGSPAAGTFEGWPKQLNELRVLDPCMGSGHFLAFALPILVKMAEIENGLTTPEAVQLVLSQNLYGLEIDPRCSQIAAFNLALTAWRLLGRYVQLPPMNLACSGLGINASRESWEALAGDNGLLKDTLAELYTTFQKAPTLGSLIDPTRVGRPLLFAKFDEVWPALERALTAEQPDDESRELAVAARGVLTATRTLAAHFTLVATNVPYLGRGKQNEILAQYCDETHPAAKADLATCFLERCNNLRAPGGSVALVTPQNWLFLMSYKKLRERLLRYERWEFVAKLGPNAFRDMNWWAATTVLVCLSRSHPTAEHQVMGWDVSEAKTPSDKAEVLSRCPYSQHFQSAQLSNPDARVSLSAHSTSPRLSERCKSFLGLGTGDYPHYGRLFWELPAVGPEWTFQQCTVESSRHWGGREHLVAWDHTVNRVLGMTSDEREQIHNQDQSGQQAWGKRGIAVGLMNDLKCTIYSGEKHDKALAVLVPDDENDLPALWCLCSSPEYNRLVRELDQNVIVANATLTKIPFDLPHWSEIAATDYPLGLPAPHSNDPTQWLFGGHPREADSPLQVAVARILGYRWPRMSGSHFRDCPPCEPDGLEGHGDNDGIVCLCSVGGDETAAYRIRGLLEDAYGHEWSARRLAGLLGGAESLEGWLRDRFFQEHCGLFHGRPFIWHIWDGRKDGFHALVNYHKLAGPAGEGKRTLEKLIYSSLGDWIGRQRAEVAGGADGAEARLAAALHLQSELEKILAGEAPYDIFVRWKPVEEQAIGWEPDLNDGVRLNLRPWLTAKPYQPSRKDACILRITPIRLPLGKDRGKEPSRDNVDFPWFADSQDRTNDIHLTLKEKQKARERKKS